MQAFLSNWWNRPCGGRDVMVLALPLVISMGSWTVMNFVDRIFLLWYSPVAMAAAMPAGVFYFALVSFPMGLASYVNTFVAQYHGAGRPQRIGVAVWQGIRIGLYFAPVIFVVALLAPRIFALAGHDSGVAAHEVLYFQSLSYGAAGFLFATAISAFFTGRGQTRVVMIVDVGASVMNLVLDWLLIFGHAGFPELGIEGAGIATSISQWAKVLAYVGILQYREYRVYQLGKSRVWDADLMRRLLIYGGPNGLQMFVEIGAFTFFLLLVGRLGPDALASSTLAFNVNSVAFVPVLGMGIAVSTLVGQQLGAGRDDLAARATWTAFVMSALYSAPFAVLYVTAPDVFLAGYKMGANPEHFQHLRDTAVVLLWFVTAYCIFDMMNVIFVSAIKGAGDTRFVLVTTCIVAPLPVLAGWAGMHYMGWGLMWCWWVITIWIYVVSMIYLFRFLGGQWRKMRVIEEQPSSNTGGADSSLEDSHSPKTGTSLKDGHEDPTDNAIPVATAT